MVTGGSSFTSTNEVSVIQALLHTLANPHDTQTGLFRLLSSDMFRLDADDFCQLGTRAQEVLDAPTKRPIEQCFIDGELAFYGIVQPSERLRLAHEVLRRAFSRLGRWQVADVCQAALEESGWLQRLEQQGMDGMAVAANLLAAVRYVRDLTTTLGLGSARAADEFAQWLAAAKLTPAMLVGDTVDAVQVMTIHGSKGLQFAVTAVAECWGNPSTSGKLSFGRSSTTYQVCLAPRPSTKGFSGMCKAVEPADSWKSCRSVAERALLLDRREEEAEAAEKARLLYVALTRAEEALVVGIPVSEKEGYRSAMAMRVLGAFPELAGLEPGERAFAVTPQAPIECERRGEGGADATRTAVAAAPGVARIVQLAHRGRGKDDPWDASSAGSMPGFDGELPSSVTLVPLLGVDGAAPAAVTPVAAQGDFTLYDVVSEEPKLVPWKARTGVFSYSSAHAQMEGEARARGNFPQAAEEAAAPAAGSAPEKPAVRQVPKQPPTPPVAQQEAEAEGAPYADDADKATNLGSAFHELAQTMIETGEAHRVERLEALARTWHLSVRQTARLREAVARWEGCALRREALSYALVRAEVPFFVRVDARYGSYVEGAIDLLACNPGSTKALVVDYKTGDVGLSLAQIEQRHRMQANFYAWVMRDQGFNEVECAFVCVEVDDGAGGPVVVRYRFDDANPPSIG